MMSSALFVETNFMKLIEQSVKAGKIAPGL